MPMSMRQALHLATRQVEALPLPAEIHPLGLKMRKGDLVMIAGRPGAGKSMFVDWLVWRMGMSALSFSADMSPFDSTSRMAARVTGHTIDAVERGFKGAGRGFYEDALDEVLIKVCFDSTITLDGIVEELDAYVEINDVWPDVVVIDHLNKVEGGDDFQGQKFILAELHSLARRIEALVFVLHHASQVNQKDPTLPVPGREIENKVTHYPAIVLTVALDGVSELFRVAKVKNRSGSEDPKALNPLTLAADPARCSYGVVVPDAVRNYWEREVE